MKSNYLTDTQIKVLKEIKDAGVFWSDSFGGADIQIVGSGTRYYVLYQRSGTIIEIKKDDEVDCLISESARLLKYRRQNKRILKALNSM